MKYLGLAAAIIGLAACGAPTQEAFVERFSESFCELAFACEPAQFEGFFGDEAGCRDAYEMLLTEAGDGCEYDEKAAKSCLSIVNSTECDTVADESSRVCDTVFNCVTN